MSNPVTCSICASILNRTSEKAPLSEKSPPHTSQTRPHRILTCCGRATCERCIERNPRFEAYCPFCQITSEPSALPQGLRDPPGYDSSPGSPPTHDDYERILDSNGDLPPAYTPLDSRGSIADNKPAPDVTHHLHPSDTVQSLSLAYEVPIQVLRRHNNLYTDHLLQGRRTVSIPGSHYKRGVSLSPRPVEGEEESERKAKVRRFMVQSKCHQYEVAEVYLNNAKGDVARALERWKEDEKWERENPMKSSGKGKVGRRKDASGGLTGQMS